MSVESRHDARVAQAHAEVGLTAVRRPVAWLLVTVFIAVIATVPLAQAWHDPAVLRFTPGQAGDRLASSVVSWFRHRNRGLLAAIEKYIGRKIDVDTHHPFHDTRAADRSTHHSKRPHGKSFHGRKRPYSNKRRPTTQYKGNFRKKKRQGQTRGGNR